MAVQEPKRDVPAEGVAGLGAAPIWEDALDAALLDLIKIKAIASTFGQYPALATEVAPAPQTQMLLAELKGHAYARTGILPVQMFGVHVAVSCIVGERDSLPQVAAGAAAGFTAGDAVDEAVRDALHTFHDAATILASDTPLMRRPSSRQQRLLWWAVAGRTYVDKLIGSGAPAERLSPGELPSTTSREVRRSLEESGPAWAFADITPDWSSDLRVARIEILPSASARGKGVASALGGIDHDEPGTQAAEANMPAAPFINLG